MTLSEITSLFGFNLGFIIIGLFAAWFVVALFILAYAINPNYISTPLNWIKDAYLHLFDFFKFSLQHSPKPITIIIFLLIILTISNLLFPIVLGNFLICGINGQAYTPKSIFSNLVLNSVASYQIMATSINSTFNIPIVDKVITIFPPFPEDSPVGDFSFYGSLKIDDGSTPIINIGCTNNNKPNLMFYKTEIFSYKLWIMLFLVFGIITAFIKLRSYAK